MSNHNSSVNSRNSLTTRSSFDLCMHIYKVMSKIVETAFQFNIYLLTEQTVELCYGGEVYN